MARPSRFAAEFRAPWVQLVCIGIRRTAPSRRWPGSWASVRRRSASGCARTRRTVVRPPEKLTSAQLAELARLKRENTELRRTNVISGGMGYLAA
jgi:transposase-like protein